ncbi:class I SAM-dependent methyltransferase [Streptomyces syringium]|uniref:class I SAM-dependent methyltransferase n=1 Tax=Streptomyces syringium TaxID=76729 RepID=UPI0034561F99
MHHIPGCDGQLSGLGREYEDTAEVPFRAHMEIPGMLRAIGGVAGLAVLDAGCGTGLYARMLARRGGSPVVGIAASAGMLATARGLEQREPLGIDHRVGDLTLAQGLSVNAVAACYLLPYARAEADLTAMCQSLATALRPGGRLVTAVINPDFSNDPQWYRAYGFSLTTAGQHAEGDPVVLSVAQAELIFEVTAYHGNRPTVESALWKAGFTEISWTRLQVSQEGVEGYGRAFWDNYLARPHALIVVAQRAGDSA